MGSRMKGGLRVTRQGISTCGRRQQKRPGSGTGGKSQLFDGLVLFLVLTCYITLENKNISKIIYNIYIFIFIS